MDYGKLMPQAKYYTKLPEAFSAPSRMHCLSTATWSSIDRGEFVSLSGKGLPSSTFWHHARSEEDIRQRFPAPGCSSLRCHTPPAAASSQGSVTLGFQGLRSDLPYWVVLRVPAGSGITASGITTSLLLHPHHHPSNIFLLTPRHRDQGLDLKYSCQHHIQRGGSGEHLLWARFTEDAMYPRYEQKVQADCCKAGLSLMPAFPQHARRLGIEDCFRCKGSIHQYLIASIDFQFHICLTVATGHIKIHQHLPCTFQFRLCHQP